MKKEKILGRDEILNAPDLPFVKVEVPEWGGAVFVRGLSGGERDEFETKILGTKGSSLKNARAKLVAMGTFDESGTLLFAESDVEALGKKSGKALDRLFSAIRKESGLLDADVMELVKNFVGGLKDDSISA